MSPSFPKSKSSTAKVLFTVMITSFDPNSGAVSVASSSLTEILVSPKEKLVYKLAEDFVEKAEVKVS